MNLTSPVSMSMPAGPGSAMAAYQRARRYVLGGLLFAIGLLLVFIQSAHDELTHERIESVGIMLILVGIGGRLWSTLYIGGRKSAEVVDTGPYSMTRNPLYFFSAIAAIGVGAQVGSYVLGALFGILCWLAFSVVIRREERFLGEQLGQPYRDYVLRVPRFFPNPLLYKDRREVTFKPKLLNQTMIDGLAFFISVPLFELIEMGQESGVIPVLLRLP